MTSNEIGAPDVLDKLLDQLRTSLSVSLAVAPGYLRNAFTGRNQRRRRDKGMTKEYAHWIATNIAHQYSAQRNGTALATSEVGDIICSFLLQVPDELAGRAGSRSGYESHEAIKQIAAGLCAAIVQDCCFARRPPLATHRISLA